MTRLNTTFAALVIIQAVHSVEEYVGRLWAVFTPAMVITGLVSQDRRLGFIVINAAQLFGLWCFFGRFGAVGPGGGGFIGFWVMIKITNSIGDVFWTLRQHMYTAPAL